MTDALLNASQCRPGPPATTRFASPPGTTDCHFHIFGPADAYPYLPERRFTPQQASCGDYDAACKALGIARAVLVQPSVYGFDNRRLLDARSELNVDTRLVVMVPPEVSSDELDHLSDHGAVGVRVIGTVPGSAPLSSIEALGEKLHRRGWHIQLLLNPQLLLEYQEILARMRCNIVIDHIAHISAARKGLDRQAFDVLLRLVETGRIWVKLSAPYHLSSASPPYADIGPMVQELFRMRNDRMIWGTDWPCINFHGSHHEPADLLDAVHQWLPDEDDRKRVLVDNPATLYSFPAHTAR